MKKLLLIYFFVLISNAFSQVQYKYYEVPSGTTSDLKDIGIFKSSNPYLYYFCGNNGTLLASGGADSLCRPIQTGVTFTLNSFFKLSGTTYLNPAMFFGDGGMLLCSSNGGSNWYQQNPGFSGNLYSGIYFSWGSIYSYRTVAVGSGGLILYRSYLPTTNTGWKFVSSGTTSDLKYITSASYNSEKFWIAGANGTILNSNDTGNTWTKKVSGISSNLNSIIARNKDTLYAAGDGGVILMTTNGGLNWNKKNSNTTQNLNTIGRYDDTTIFIAGTNIVLISTNKGASWNADTAAPKINYNSVNFLYSPKFRKTVPVFAGDGGKIFKRTLDTTFHPNIDVLLDGNNIGSSFNGSGTFNQNYYYTNTPGFEWPKGSGKHAMFTSGLSISAFYNNALRQAMASYKGEYVKGYCENEVYKTNAAFKYYKISRGDNYLNNWDWANWGLMVPYGAPFIDVNANGRYEPEIDTPGVKNASQTIFYCMTDADSTNHNSGEGFGGGIQPVFAEVHLTAWAYDTPGLEDVQFINYVIINKGKYSWKRAYVGIFSDPDLGDAVDDFTGCDTSLELGYCYNAVPTDFIYGVNPPAVGFTLLTGMTNKNATPVKNLGMTSFAVPIKYACPCEYEATGEPICAHRFLSGYKKDSTSWLDPTFSPPVKTKYCYSDATGWTEFKGSIRNCNLDSTGPVVSNVGGDRKFIFSSGDENLEIAPGDTQRFVIAQMIARGTSNLNSITKLKGLCRSVRTFYESNFPFVITPTPVITYPEIYMLDQNYPNPFNATTRIKFHIPKINGTVSGTVRVTLKIYDMLGRLVQTLVNGDYSAQDYEVIFDGKNFASGMYFYKMTAGDYTSVKRMVLVK